MNKQHGKLIMLAILAVLCLAACGRTDVVTLGGNEMVSGLPESAGVFLRGYAFNEAGEYFWGTGIRVNNLDEAGNEVSSEELMFPVYRGEELIGLLLIGETEELIMDGTALRLFADGTDRTFDVVRIGGGLYRIGPDSMELIAGEASEMTERDRKTAEAISSSLSGDNHMGEERTLYKSVELEPAPVTLYDAETGKTYSSSRIVVKFTEGDEEEKVLWFEEFCGGQLHGRVRAAGRYTFKFAPKQNIKQLKALLRDAQELDYVADAMLEEARGMH